MKVTRGPAAEAVVLSGSISVTTRFFDGFIGKIVVGANVPDYGLKIGSSPEDMGFTGSQPSFIHWGLLIGSEIEPRIKPQKYLLKAAIKKIVPSLVPIYTVIFKASKAYEAFELLYENKPVFINVDSEIAIDYDDTEQMLVTTREGNATIFTEATDAEGFSVPAGKTGIIGPDLKPKLKDTDSETAQRADELLKGMNDSLSQSPEFVSPGIY
jgi:hypothetical protein